MPIGDEFVGGVIYFGTVPCKAPYFLEEEEEKKGKPTITEPPRAFSEHTSLKSTSLASQKRGKEEDCGNSKDPVEVKDGGPSIGFEASMKKPQLLYDKGSSTSGDPEVSKITPQQSENGKRLLFLSSLLLGQSPYKERHCGFPLFKKFVLIDSKDPDVARVERGTTTLAFVFKDAVFVAADHPSNSPSPKLIQVASHIVATISGGSEFLLSNLKKKCEQKLRDGKTVDIEKAAKWLAHDLAPRHLSVGVLIGGWGDDGPAVYRVNHKGEMENYSRKLTGPRKKLFSTGSGSKWACAHMLFGFRKGMSEADAEDLVKDAICRASCKALYSGDFASVYRVGSSGCELRISGYDVGKWRNEHEELVSLPEYQYISVYPPY